MRVSRKILQAFLLGLVGCYRGFAFWYTSISVSDRRIRCNVPVIPIAAAQPEAASGTTCGSGLTVTPLSQAARFTQQRDMSQMTHIKPPRINNRRIQSSHRLHSIISSGDQWSIYASLAAVAAVGLKSEKSVMGKSLSGPVTAMLIASILTNVGFLPHEGSIYVTSLQQFVVKLATPLLLLGADLREIFRETGILLKAFLLGSIGTLLGSTVAFTLFGRYLDCEGWKIVSALTAKNIGGGLNFMAVADSLAISSKSIATGLAVDNIVGLMYFPFIAWLGRNDVGMNSSVINSNMDSINNSSISSTGSLDSTDGYLSALAIGLSIVALAELAAKAIQLPSILIATCLSVAAATLASPTLRIYKSFGETMGKVLLYLFFASVGISSGRFVDLLSSPGTLPLLAFGLTMYAIHILFIFYTGKHLKIDTPDILVASNANIGNAATAAAFANSMGWGPRALPALLVGTFGNIIGTFAGLWLGKSILQYWFL